MKHPLVIIGLIIILTLGLYVALDEPTRATALEPNGVVDQGSAFGVSVGDPRERALGSLGNRFQHYETRHGGRCGVREYSDSHTIDVFTDDSWRKGTVCVASVQGRVVEMNWVFNPFMP